MAETARAGTEPAKASPWRQRILLAIPVAVFAALAGLFAVSLLRSGDPSRVPSVLLDRPAPTTNLPPLEGLRASDGAAVPGWESADLTQPGRVTIVNVWASWCAPCRTEHPVLSELARDPSIRLVGFNYKDKPENARRFLGAFGNPFAAVGVDDTGRTAIDWGVYGVPETFVVGPDGVIRFKQVGPLAEADLPGFLRQVRKAAAR